METITISKKEYNELKEKEKIADNAVVQLKLSIEDIKKGRISKF